MDGRRIGVVTGTRADYGHLYWLLREIEQDSELKLLLFVTGMHLSPEFGLTYKILEEDGFLQQQRVEILLSSDTAVGACKSVGLGVLGFADAFQNNRPDLLVVLGDRFEALAAVQAAYLLKIPIAHLHGGEVTEGAFDEGIRHAITKLSYLHFTSNEQHRRRVIQLGEDPARVFNFGAPGLDNVLRLKLKSRGQLEQELNFRLASPLFLVTYHPVTLSGDSQVPELHALFAALDEFPQATVVITLPNADPGSRELIESTRAWGENQATRVLVSTSLGQLRYLSMLNIADVVIGNSSSGIIEAPSFKIPVVNIGERQRGRMQSPSTLNTSPVKAEICSKIEMALDPDFRKGLSGLNNPYGNGNSSPRIKEVLKTYPLQALSKSFHDLPG